MNQLRIKVLVTIIIVIASVGVFGLIKNSANNETLSDKFLREFKSTTSNGYQVFDKYYGPLDADTMLAILEEDDPFCHTEVHDLGKVIFDRTKSIQESFNQCGTGCLHACIHGVLMGAFKDETGSTNRHVLLQDIAEDLPTICSQPTNSSISEGNCIHGLGHAVLFLTEYNLDTALQQCKAFSNKKAEMLCASGVFMEYARNGIRPENVSLHYPCDVHTEFPAACYVFRISSLAPEPNNIKSVALQCQKLSPVQRRGCFFSYGFHIGPDIYSQPEQLAASCDFENDQDKKNCFDGVIRHIGEFYPRDGFKLCYQIKADYSYHDCLQAAATGIYNIYNSFTEYIEER